MTKPDDDEKTEETATKKEETPEEKEQAPEAHVVKETEEEAESFAAAQGRDEDGEKKEPASKNEEEEEPAIAPPASPEATKNTKKEDVEDQEEEGGQQQPPQHHPQTTPMDPNNVPGFQGPPGGSFYPPHHPPGAGGGGTPPNGAAMMYPWNPTFMPYHWGTPPPGWGQQQQGGGGGNASAGLSPAAGYPMMGGQGYAQPPPPDMMAQFVAFQTHAAGSSGGRTVNAEDYRDFLVWQQTREGESGSTPASKGTTTPRSTEKKPRKKKRKNGTDVAKSLIALNESENAEKLDTPWAHLVEGCELVCPQLRADIPDALYVAIGQFKTCGLTQDDRVGKYKSRDIGFVGMCCKHCGGQPGFGRYFPGSYDSFLNGTNCEGIVKHIKEDCRACPKEIRDTVVELAKEETPADSRPRYGSRKRFYSFVWTKLRQTKVPEEDGEGEEYAIGAANMDGTDSALDKIVAGSDIVSIKDRHLVSDTTLVAMAQMKVCYVTEDDRIGRCKDHTIGFKGLCCRHCGGKAGKPGYGRYFPSSLRSLAQADSCQQIIKHITSKCTQVPADIRTVIVDMHKKEKSERIKYGSRKIFFRRVWSRLHGKGGNEEAPMAKTAAPKSKEDEKEAGTVDATTTATATAPSSTDKTAEEIPWDIVIGDSEVVSLDDRGLISDAQLAAIAQMNICKLTEADRIGWFKSREIGFGGLCCKHCGGRPSFGRYFPNSVRSFQQTTSSQTIMSHIAMYCQACPKEIREIIIKLQNKENSDEPSQNSALYGSRKVFFDRVWNRMHGKDNTVKNEENSEQGESEAPPPEKDEAENKTENGADNGSDSGSEKNKKRAAAAEGDAAEVAEDEKDKSPDRKRPKVEGPTMLI